MLGRFVRNATCIERSRSSFSNLVRLGKGYYAVFRRNYTFTYPTGDEVIDFKIGDPVTTGEEYYEQIKSLRQKMTEPHTLFDEQKQDSNRGRPRSQRLSQRQSITIAADQKQDDEGKIFLELTQTKSHKLRDYRDHLYLVKITGIAEQNPGLIIDARNLYLYGFINDTRDNTDRKKEQKQKYFHIQAEENDLKKQKEIGDACSYKISH